MARLEDERTVIEVACLTADRTRGEHAAMKRVAKRVTREWNKRTITNKRERFEHPVDLVELVETTRDHA